MSAKHLILLMALLIMCALPGCANDASTDTEIDNIEKEESESVEPVEALENEPPSSEDESETNPMDDQTQEKETETEINGADSEDKKTEAVYLGVEGYGTVGRNSMSEFRYRFFIDGEEVLYMIDNGPQNEDGTFSYPVQNILKEGYVYRLQIEDDTVLSAEDAAFLRSGTIAAVTEDGFIVDGNEYPGNSIWKISRQAGGAKVEETEPQKGDTAFITEDDSGKCAYLMQMAEPYSPPVSGIPGCATLKNFLATAMMPVGTTLYIYGGAWDWQDAGSSVQATEIGLPDEWISFFQTQNEDYTFQAADPVVSYYPFSGWNEYYFAGADCSGYVGWVLYNTMHDKDGEDGYVVYAGEYAGNLSDRGWGTYSGTVAIPNGSAETAVRPGDIMSMSGHVWISLGTCSDGSVVIAHSIPSASHSGQPGGGVQLSALGYSEDCEAYRLAKQYMTQYYPAWSKRYSVTLHQPEAYLAAAGNGTGLFSWDVSDRESGLTDPEGYRDMTPQEILAELFEQTG